MYPLKKKFLMSKLRWVGRRDIIAERINALVPRPAPLCVKFTCTKQS
jgi:hypothetical protein